MENAPPTSTALRPKYQSIKSTYVTVRPSVVHNCLRYDTILYIYVRSKADDMASLVKRPAQ